MWTYITHRVIKHRMFSTKHVIKHRDKTNFILFNFSVSISHDSRANFTISITKPFLRISKFGDWSKDPASCVDRCTHNIDRSISTPMHRTTPKCRTTHKIDAMHQSDTPRVIDWHTYTIRRLYGSNSVVYPKLYFSTKMVSFYMLD